MSNNNGSSQWRSFILSIMIAVIIFSLMKMLSTMNVLSNKEQEQMLVLQLENGIDPTTTSTIKDEEDIEQLATTFYGDTPKSDEEEDELAESKPNQETSEEFKGFIRGGAVNKSDPEMWIQNSKGVKPSPRMFWDETNVDVKNLNLSGGIHIITSYFQGTYHKARIREIVTCIRKNLENPYVEAVHILWEDQNPRELLPKNITQKLITTKIPRQPTYFRLFSYVNQFLKRGSIAIVTNSDIYFDKSLRSISFGSLTKNPDDSPRTAYALSRRHAPECGNRRDWKSTYDLCLTYIGSHDAFVFAPPTPKRVMQNSDHTQNHFGAENIIVWGFLWAQNYRVLNPCERIHAIHLHCSGERHYSVGRFISYGRHGRMEPGVPKGENSKWNVLY